MTERPALGDFTRPQQKAPTAALDQQGVELKKEESEIKAALKPMEAHEAALKEVGVTKEQASEIIDSILLQGYYQERFKITNKISGVFRSRVYADTERLQSWMEATRPAYEATIQETTFRYLLAASISEFNGEKFLFPKKEDTLEEADRLFNIRLRYIRAMPDALVSLLYQKLSKFDQKLAVCLQTGAIANF